MARTRHLWKCNQHLPLLLSSPAQEHVLTLPARTLAGREASAQASTASAFPQDPFGAHILSWGASTLNHQLQGHHSHLGWQPRRLPTTLADGRKGLAAQGWLYRGPAFGEALVVFSPSPVAAGPGSASNTNDAADFKTPSSWCSDVMARP